MEQKFKYRIEEREYGEDYTVFVPQCFSNTNTQNNHWTTIEYSGHSPFQKTIKGAKEMVNIHKRQHIEPIKITTHEI